MARAAQVKAGPGPISASQRRLSNYFQMPLISAIASMVIGIVATVAVEIINAAYSTATPVTAVNQLGPYIFVLLGFVALVVFVSGVAILWLRKPSRIRRLKDELTTAFLDGLDESPLNPRPRSRAVHD